VTSQRLSLAFEPRAGLRNPLLPRPLAKQRQPLFRVSHLRTRHLQRGMRRFLLPCGHDVLFVEGGLARRLGAPAMLLGAGASQGRFALRDLLGP
jgi:hypothetical protein